MANLMKLQRAHVIKLKPNREQETYFRRACGVRRWTYNWALNQWEAWWELYNKDAPRPGWMRLSKYFDSVKDSMCPWVREVSSRITARAIRDANAAYQNWFKAMKRGDAKWGRPQRAKYGVKERFYVHKISLKFRTPKYVFIEKCGVVRTFEEFRFPEAKILSGSIQKKADGWYLSIQTEFEIDEPKKRDDNPIGVDAGITRNFTLSNGELLHLPRSKMQALDRKIKRAQKNLSRKWHGKPKQGHKEKALRDENGKLLPKSNRFLIARDRVSKLRLKQARIREHYLHQFSRELVGRFSKICIEDLNLKNMTKSAKGDAEKPGKNVKAKSGLNREMLNVAIGEFRWMLEYKSEETGSEIIPVDYAYSSQTCSVCGYCDSENRVVQSRFECQKCGHFENADINAAKNILQWGLNNEKQ